VKALEGGDVAASRDPAALDDPGDDADGTVVRVLAGEDEDAVLVADVGDDRRGHAREQDALIEGDEQKSHIVRLQCGLRGVGNFT
jgi:hypothetical protein